TDSGTSGSKPLRPFMCEKESVRPPKIGCTRDVREIKERVVPFHIRSLKIGFCAEHEPFIPLPVVTDLAATDEATWIRTKTVRLQVDERSGIRQRIEIRIGISPAVAGIGSDVEAGPIEIAFWRRRRCDCFTFFPTVHFGSGERTRCQRAAREKYTH